MEYITHKRFRGQSICGEINIPAGTIIECNTDGLLSYQGRPVYFEQSENSHLHFTRNDDENGMLRGQLIRAIKSKLEKRNVGYQERWDKVWNDPVCQKYKRKEYADYWLWNHDFLTLRLKI